MDQMNPAPPDIPPIPPAPPAPPPTSPHLPKSPLFLILGIIILIVIIATGAYLLGKSQYKSTPSNISSSPTPSLYPEPSRRATPDPTANWKTYVNVKYFFTLKYPLEKCKIKTNFETKDYATIYINCNSVVTITIFNNPSSFSPLVFWKNSIEETINGKITCNNTNTECATTYSHEGENYTAQYMVANTIIDGQKAVQVKNHPSFPSNSVELYIPYKGYMYEISYDTKLEEHIQILSTFKFFQ